MACCAVLFLTVCPSLFLAFAALSMNYSSPQKNTLVIVVADHDSGLSSVDILFKKKKKNHIFFCIADSKVRWLNISVT